VIDLERLRADLAAASPLRPEDMAQAVERLTEALQTVRQDLVMVVPAAAVERVSKMLPIGVSAMPAHAPNMVVDPEVFARMREALLIGDARRSASEVGPQRQPANRAQRRAAARRNR
jgi:hypothetical protein